MKLYVNDTMQEREALTTINKNVTKKNTELSHDCEQMQKRLMDEKIKMMEAWNEITMQQEVACRNCGLKPNEVGPA